MYIADPAIAIPDLLSRREFIALRTKDRDPAKDSLRKHGLIMEGNQLFTGNFMNPHTPFTRLVLKRSVGTGKTVATLNIAREFIEAYRAMREHDGTSPTVFIVCFTKDTFRAELLRKPELGAISREKHEEYMRLRKLAGNGLPQNIAKYNEYVTKLKREQTDVRMGGFYQFYGYQEFVNRLFTFTADAPVTHVFENGVQDAVTRGWIKINESFLKRFENSLMICDEIHDVYNSLEQNNYGVAIQYVLDNAPGIRAVFASATIINNSPTEIIDLLNLLIPKETRKKFLPASQGNAPLFQKSDFFAGKRLKPGAAERIGAISRGYVSTVLNVDTYDFPTKVLKGEPFEYIVDGKKHTLPMGLIRCPMSKKHYAAYQAMVGDRPDLVDADDVAVAETDHTVFDMYTLRDMVFPMPTVDAGDGVQSPSDRVRSPSDDDSSLTGSANYLSVKNTLLQHPLGSYIKPIKEFSSTSFTGNFLRYENIGKWSAKYKAMIDTIDTFLADPTSGKIMIYHNFVGASGVILLRELLMANGILNDMNAPTADTKCAICGVAMAKHPTTGATRTYEERLVDGVLAPPADGRTRGPHAFTPARVITITGDVSNIQRETLKMMFNQPQNAWGEYFKILLVSKVFTQSHEAFAVQQMLVMAMPYNIPTLTQVIGRALRKGGHRILPPQNRVVNVYAFVSSLPKSVGAGVSREEAVYIDKFTDFEEIKLIDYHININALDPMFHEEIEHPDALDPLPYEPMYKVPMDGRPAGSVVTFNAFGRYKFEISLIIWIIKDLFLQQTPVWVYDDLFAAVRSPPFKLSYDCSTISEQNFAVALTFLTRVTHGFAANIDDDRFIVKNGKMMFIVQVGKYFILAGAHHLSFDSFERGSAKTDMIVLTSEQIIDTIHGGFFEQQFGEYIGRIDAKWKSSAPLSLIWGVGDVRFYTTLWRRYIEKSLAVPQRLVNIFKDFGVFVHSGNSIVGYKVFRRQMTLKKQGWEAIGFSPDTIKENDVIGFYAPSFKLRAKFLSSARTIDNTRRKGDKRLLRKGLVCQSHAKEDLVKIAHAVGIDTSQKGSRDICAQIEDKLLQLEHLQRTGSHNLRYVYLPTETGGT